ncbi:hypothetical protein SAMN05444007_109146 [Cribrihabitans marinus]|uniref:Uncharacterized protein n=1 Tax=Cribrihabitans marinus TaxID=1227549 RepID=A0A1H7D366_9RHOB|nr:iron-containing alcohol dehydrogenase [Cribrihabitans marinus]GGH37482.1 alcohol dehydrogenase [Cribrihabitans marinus]SEJ95794.1 hypothetical protein SAMN05444007_109146 [Cribrihabitans marinus]
MDKFTLTLPGHVLFGRGTARRAVSEVLARGKRPLVVRGRSCGFADELIADLEREGAKVTVLSGSGEPTLPQLETALRQAQEAGPTVVLAIGGGSVIDLAKAVAALLPQEGAPLDYLEVVGRGQPLERDPLPVFALPSTAGTGAEATRNAVIGVPGAARKVSLRDPRMIPDLAIVDPALTDGCPRHVTLASGLDALTQVIEPYLSKRANPLTDAICRDAIPRGLSALTRLMQGDEPGARDEMAYVSLCGGIALANAGLGAVHGLAGVIGGRTGLAHGAICGRLLVPALVENRAALLVAGLPVERIDWLCDLLADTFGTGADTALTAFQRWIDAQGLPYLPDPGDAGETRTAWAREAQGASSMKSNPVDLDARQLGRILSAATQGA